MCSGDNRLNFDSYIKKFRKRMYLKVFLFSFMMVLLVVFAYFSMATRMIQVGSNKFFNKDTVSRIENIMNLSASFEKNHFNTNKSDYDLSLKNYDKYLDLKPSIETLRKHYVVTVKHGSKGYYYILETKSFFPILNKSFTRTDLKIDHLYISRNLGNLEKYPEIKQILKSDLKGIKQYSGELEINDDILYKDILDSYGSLLKRLNKEKTAVIEANKEFLNNKKTIEKKKTDFFQNLENQVNFRFTKREIQSEIIFRSMIGFVLVTISLVILFLMKNELLHHRRVSSLELLLDGKIDKDVLEMMEILHPAKNENKNEVSELLSILKERININLGK